MPLYATATDVYAMFGRDNAWKWANLTNESDADSISAKIALAIDDASEYVAGKLILSKFPYVYAEGHVPKVVRFLTVLLAGIYLYDARAIMTLERTTDEMSRTRSLYEKTERALLAGQIALLDPLSGERVVERGASVPCIY